MGRFRSSSILSSINKPADRGSAFRGVDAKDAKGKREDAEESALGVRDGDRDRVKKSGWAEASRRVNRTVSFAFLRINCGRLSNERHHNKSRFSGQLFS